MAQNERQKVDAAHKRQIAEIMRQDRRRENILKAMKAGLQRYANSTRGGKVLGVKCSVRIETGNVIMKCKDGSVYKLGFK
jgi:hypothetical protein